MVDFCSVYPEKLGSEMQERVQITGAFFQILKLFTFEFLLLNLLYSLFRCIILHDMIVQTLVVLKQFEWLNSVQYIQENLAQNNCKCHRSILRSDVMRHESSKKPKYKFARIK